MNHLGAEPVTGLVKWFDPARGFGFVVVGSPRRDAFLHASALSRSGAPAPAQGDRISCVLGVGFRGLQVEAVLPGAAQGGEPRAGATVRGKVKFYDAARGYGFVTSEAGDEVFVGAKTLRRLGLTPLREGQGVRLTVARGDLGMVAETLTFLP